MSCCRCSISLGLERRRHGRYPVASDNGWPWRERPRPKPQGPAPRRAVLGARPAAEERAVGCDSRGARAVSYPSSARHSRPLRRADHGGPDHRLPPGARCPLRHAPRGDAQSRRPRDRHPAGRMEARGPRQRVTLDASPLLSPSTFAPLLWGPARTPGPTPLFSTTRRSAQPTSMVCIASSPIAICGSSGGSTVPPVPLCATRPSGPTRRCPSMACSRCEARAVPTPSR